MAIPLGAATLGADVLGGIFGGLSQAKQTKEQLKQSKTGMRNQLELGRRGANLEEGAQASDYERRLNMAPLRDRVLYNLMQRAGAPSPAFRPTDMFNPAISADIPQLGGVDRDALAARVGAYTPGAGGVTTDVMQRAMEVLGYRPDGSYMSPKYRADIRPGGVDPYGIEAHGYSPEDRADYKPKLNLAALLQQHGTPQLNPAERLRQGGGFSGLVDPRVLSMQSRFPSYGA